MPSEEWTEYPDMFKPTITFNEDGSMGVKYDNTATAIKQNCETCEKLCVQAGYKATSDNYPACSGKTEDQEGEPDILRVINTAKNHARKEMSIAKGRHGQAKQHGRHSEAVAWHHTWSAYSDMLSKLGGIK